MVELAIAPRGAKLPAAVTELASAIEADGGAALEEFDLGKIHFGQIRDAAQIAAATSVADPG